MTRYIFALLVLSLAASCTTTSGPSFEKAEVLERIGDRDVSPDWADGSKVMWEEDSHVIFVNVVRMSGNSRPDACMKAASLGAKSEMLKHIKQSITVSGQLDESSLEGDPAYESLTAFLSQGNISGAKVSNQYWEKRVESDESGDRVLRLACAAKITVKKSELAKQLRVATNPKSQGNPKIRDALMDAQQNFINGLSPAH